MSRRRFKTRRRPRTRRVPRIPDAIAAPLIALHRRIFRHEVDPFVLGVYRIALGLLVLLYLIMLAANWATFYGPGGISAYAGGVSGGYRFPEPILRHVESAGTLWAIYGVSIAAAAALTAGVGARIALVWLFVVNHSLLYANPYVANGEEQVFAVLLPLSIFLPLGRSLTLPQLLDPARRPAIFASDEKVETWALVPLQIHIALIYLYGLPLKLGDDAWQSGLVVYYAMMAMDYPRFPGVELFAWADALLSRVLTYATLCAELVTPIFIWFRKFRLICVGAAVLIHTSLGVLLEGVMMFNAAMIVAWLLFLPSRRTREWLARRRP